MSAPRLLDLFCGGGGCSMGYARAGFEVVGVDVVPQPNYPFEFHQADAMTFPLDGFDVVHASPPCQDHSRLSAVAGSHETGWMLAATIDRLKESGAPWIVENVEGKSVTMDGWWFVLCGSMFGLRVRRHRRFGSSHLFMPPDCRHAEQGQPLGVYGSSGTGRNQRGVKAKRSEECEAMGIDWMTHKEITQAVPPAYTEWIGRQLREWL